MIEVRAELCPQNHTCPTLLTCPVGALTQNGQGVPKVDEERCTGCGRCARLCPVFVAPNRRDHQQPSFR